MVARFSLFFLKYTRNRSLTPFVETPAGLRGLNAQVVIQSTQVYGTLGTCLEPEARP